MRVHRVLHHQDKCARVLKSRDALMLFSDVSEVAIIVRFKSLNVHKVFCNSTDAFVRCPGGVAVTCFGPSFEGSKNDTWPL